MLVVKMVLDPADLRPIIEAVVAETLTALRADEAVLPPGRLAYLEPEAAAILGIRAHQLRDARRRGEIVATKVGGRIAYERAELLNYLRRGRRDVK